MIPYVPIISLASRAALSYRKLWYLIAIDRLKRKSLADLTLVDSTSERNEMIEGKSKTLHRGNQIYLNKIKTNDVLDLYLHSSQSRFWSIRKTEGPEAPGGSFGCPVN
jgi:hypothetical protein